MQSEQIKKKRYVKIERIKVKKNIEEETSSIDPCKWDCVNKRLDLFPEGKRKKKQQKYKWLATTPIGFDVRDMHSINIIGDSNWSNGSFYAPNLL